MIQLTRFLGFFPVYDLSDSRPCFNLEEGRFQAFGILPGYSIDPPLSTLFGEFLHADYTSAGSIRISASTRNELLDKIIRYYMIHLPLIKEIRSHHVLREVCFESDQAGKMST
jgi:DNA repair protein RecO (recombination protein O)